MKKTEIEFIKKLSPQQRRLLTFSPIAIVILLIFGYVFYNEIGGKKQNTSTVSTQNHYDLPTADQKDMPNSVTEITEDLEKDRQAKLSQQNKDFTDLDDGYNKREKKVDSTYEKIQKQLVSLENKKATNRPYTPRTRNTTSNSTRVKKEKVLTPSQREQQELERLMKTRDMQLNSSGDISRNVLSNSNAVASNDNIKIRASIYKTQRVVSGDRVNMLLTEDLIYNGVKYDKNTVIYGFVSLAKNRLLLNVKRLNDTPVDLKAYDIQDNIEGLYSTRAGELWNDFQNQAVSGGANSVATDATTGNRAVDNTIRAFSSFLRNKKLRNSEKILLINDHELILKN